MTRWGIFFLMGMVSFGLESVVSAKEKAGEELRATIDLTGMWKFSGFLKSPKPIEEGIQKGFFKIDFDDTSWKELRVPSNWLSGYSQGERGIDLVGDFNQTYTEGWYRRQAAIPADYRGKRIIFRCDSASLETWVYVNGREAGYHYGQFAPFEFDITEHVRLGEPNFFAVRCRIDQIGEHHGGLFRGGICLPVELRIVPDVYIQRVLIDPKVSASKIDIRYSINNTLAAPREVTVEGTVDTTSQPLGKVMLKPGLNTLNLSMNMKNPVCWSPESPHLYHLTSILKTGDLVLDRKIDRFGFREFAAKGPHLYLNGKRYKLFGAGCYGVSGSIYRWGTANIPPREEKERTVADFKRDREMGLNFLRAHSAYTPPRYVLDAADEVGILFYNQSSPICGQGKLKKEYVTKQIEEIRDYLFDAYNNPSLVMVTLTNEIFSSDAREATTVYNELKSIFRDRFLFTPSSGGSIYLFAPRVKTDVIDLHNYTGWPFKSDLSNVKRSWRFMEDTIREDYARAKLSCGEKPLIVTEFPAYSMAAHWVNDNKSWLRNGKVTPETYVAVTKTPPGLWPISMYDLKNHSLYDRLTRGEGWVQAESQMIKRAAESLRRLDILQGLEPNCMLNNLQPIYKTLYKRVFICADIFDTNRFSGDALAFDLYLINDTSEEQKNLKAVVEILNKRGGKIFTKDLTAGSLAGFGKKILPFEFKIPSTLATGLYDIKLFLHANGKLVSDNFYDCYVVNKADLKKINTDKRILLLTSAHDQGGNEKAKEILDSMNLKYTLVSTAGDIGSQLRTCNLLVIAPNYNPKIRSWNTVGKHWETAGRILRQWVENGGRILSLEQYVSGPLPWAPEWEIYDAGNCWYLDMAVLEHPVYTGMSRRNFDSWNAFQGVSDQSYFIKGMTENVISAVGATSDDRYVMAAAEAKIGKGSLFVSQLNATRRYMKDSAATQYIHNLFSYALGDSLYPDIRKMKETGPRKKEISKVNPADCFCINLRPYANRSFSDDVPDDEKGGWTDQGENDLRHLSPGTQSFFDIPFDIIDPKTNNDKSCLVLKGKDRSYFPLKIETIAVNRKANLLFFLHTAAYCLPAGSVGKYIIHFSDDTQSEINLQAGVEIDDWWAPGELSGAEVAWSEKHPLTAQNVGFYIFQWNNPHPNKTIRSIDFVSNNTAVPVLLGITGYNG